MVLDHVVVDRDPGDRLVPRRGVGELADVLDRVADAERGEIHHRIAHVRVLEVDQAGDAIGLEHELERVVGDEPRQRQPARRHVVAQPAPEEHRHRVGRQALHERVVERLHRPPVPAQRGIGVVGRHREPRLGRSRDRDGVDRGRGSRGTRRAAAPARRRRRRMRSTWPGSRSMTRAYGSSQRPYACGTGTPCASSRSWVVTSSAIRYGITIWARAPPARAAGGPARRPRRRGPTPGASAPGGPPG